MFHLTLCPALIDNIGRFREKVYMDIIFQKCSRLFVLATIIKGSNTEVLQFTEYLSFSISLEVWEVVKGLLFFQNLSKKGAKVSFVFFIAHKMKWQELMMKIKCRRVIFQVPGKEKVHALQYFEI